MNINIEIGDVVLDGINFSESQAFELRQALQSELSGLFSNAPPAASFRERNGIGNVGCAVVRTGVSANHSLGQTLSLEIYGTLGKGASIATKDVGGRAT